MLSYYKQYHLAHSVFLTFQKPERKWYSNHKQSIMNKYKNIFPYYKYETYNEKTFLFTCLYIIYTYTPQSFHSMINFLRQVDKKDVANFIYDIKMYKVNIKQNIRFLKENYSDILSYELLVKLYLDKKIKFYTFYFLLLFMHQLDRLKNSRVYGIIYKKIRTIFLFMRLNKESVLEIRNFIENDLKGLIF